MSHKLFFFFKIFLKFKLLRNNNLVQLENCKLRRNTLEKKAKQMNNYYRKQTRGIIIIESKKEGNNS